MKNTEIYNSLQTEFCPPLDGSLLTALLNDVLYNGDGSDRCPTKQELDTLRLILRELVTNAEEEQTSEDFSDPNSSISPTDDTCTTPEFLASEDWTSASSEVSLDYDSPLQFLRAALPDIPITILRGALLARDEADMEDIVEDILSKQFIRELEERGLDTLSHKEAQDRLRTPQKKKKDKVKQVIAFGDVRQRPMIQLQNAVKASPDPWTSISSISTHLASLIPSKNLSFFQSFFHSPKHSTPYDAVFAALLELNGNEEEHDEVLFSLLDILIPCYPACPASILVSEAEVTISATNGDGDVALDLVHLLRSLDDDSAGGPRHHAPLPKSPSIPKSPSVSPISHAISIGAPANAGHSNEAQQIRPDKPPPNQWRTVPSRKPPSKAYEHAEFIPAYSYGAGRHKSPGNTAGKGGKGDVGELAYRRRVEENLRMRQEMVKEASRMWKKGSKKNRGGEIAFYFAERARQFQEEAQKESLNAARAMVRAKMTNSKEKNTIDLHGLTAVEAVTVVKEIMAEKPPTNASPLTIITGRGSHSANNVAVLKPVVHSALVKDGWSVKVRDASLLVSGR